MFMYHAVLSVYKLACLDQIIFLFISNLIFCLSVQRGKKTGYGHKMWRTKIHEGNFFFLNIQVLHACKCRMFSGSMSQPFFCEWNNVIHVRYFLLVEINKHFVYQVCKGSCSLNLYYIKRVVKFLGS